MVNVKHKYLIYKGISKFKIFVYPTYKSFVSPSFGYRGPLGPPWSSVLNFYFLSNLDLYVFFLQ